MHTNSGQHIKQRRRHRLAGTLFAVLLVAAWLMAAGVLGGPGSGGGPSTTSGMAPGRLLPVASTSYVVQPGDTLWSVARSLQPSGDLRPLVDRLIRLTDGGPLRVGQRIPLS